MKRLKLPCLQVTDLHSVTGGSCWTQTGQRSLESSVSDSKHVMQVRSAPTELTGQLLQLRSVLGLEDLLVKGSPENPLTPCAELAQQKEIPLCKFSQ